MIKRSVRFLESRLGSSGLVKKTLDYIFPDHWSFLLGEIALYCFLVLVATGVYLTFFFKPSYAHVVYHGDYVPLRGTKMTEAFRSTLDLSYRWKAGLLIRQTHHWAANVFIASIVMHLFRVFLTGAFRKPRDINAWIGITMLALAVVEGYAGYSLPDDLLSGMGLAIGYSVALSVPVIGAWLGTGIWGGQFPGGEVFIDRLFIAHVLIIPVLIGGLIALHLSVIIRQKHSQFPGPGKTERNVVGLKLWPAYAFRSIGLMLAVTGVLFLLGGLIQINPIWQWGPFEPYLATNGAQPDWYLGWLLGALRLMPGWELHIGGYTLIPNAFFGGLLFPLVCFALLYLWPWLERRRTHDDSRHDLLNAPSEAPRRTAAICAFASLVGVVFITGSADRIAVQIHVSYVTQIWIMRVLLVVLPPVVYFVVKAMCLELQERARHRVHVETLGPVDADQTLADR
jgi:ubiquinol-cytochrome c reductase cytochrome b subunit